MTDDDSPSEYDVEDNALDGEVLFNSHLYDDEENENSGIIGEYDENEVEDIELIPSTRSSTVVELPLSKELKTLVEERIAKLVQLDTLEKKRQEFKEQEGLDQNIILALNMQSSEGKALPELGVVRKRYSAFQQKVTAVIKAQKDEQEKAVAESSADVKKLITKELQKTWELGKEQYKILFERGELLPKIFECTKEYLKKEPLYNMLVASGYSAEKLFNLSIYTLALEGCIKSLKDLRKDKQQKAKKISTRKKGLFRRLAKEEQQKISDLEQKCDSCSETIQLITKEMKSFEKVLVEEFWKCYEFCACLLISKKIERKREPIIRVLLRYGLLGHAPWFIASDVSTLLLKDCIKNIKREFHPSQTADNVLYADEYLEHIVSNDVTGSIDEELELTGRNSPEWYADKAVRRICYSKTRAYVLKEIRSELIGKIKDLRKLQTEEEIRASKILKTSLNFKKQRASLAQSIQRCKVEAARYERIITKIDGEELRSIKDKANNAKLKLNASGITRGAFVLARKEAAAIHRVCRLCARLKDPFLPLVLRDSYNVATDVVNSREKMLEMMGYVEHADKHIFNEVLVNATKESSRVYLRVPPVILITPSCGFIGYSWNPRSGVESGKLVVPGYCPRANIRDRMIYNMLADFRWDTSKAEAGIDLLTSDTLVAAYSSCRWNYRKKKKENREKALVFNELNDRSNWRRHYELFLMSADDSGRKLFYKNYEVYEMILKYIGLPEGVERLRR